MRQKGLYAHATITRVTVRQFVVDSSGIYLGFIFGGKIRLEVYEKVVTVGKSQCQGGLGACPPPPQKILKFEPGYFEPYLEKMKS